MYKFKIPIGDWSDDGHGKHEDYLIESNKPLEEVKELYFQACDKLGFTLDGHGSLSPCSEYEESTMKEETVDRLIKFGIDITNEQKKMWTEDYVDIEEMCQLVLNLIKTQDKDLLLKIIPNKNFPMFQHYGVDEKKRHIGYFGYGLFN